MEYLYTGFFFFVVAAIYSSVGLGGGSSYLAILVLAGFAFPEIRIYSLTCNMVVVSASILFYTKHKLVDYKKAWPILITSVPMAFLGGFLKLSEPLFLLILAGTLLLVALALAGRHLIKVKHLYVQSHSLIGSIMGAGIGFISGLAGIGGGIFLAPFLNLVNFDEAKKIAATCSLFILLNSSFALGGHLLNFGFEADLNFLSAMVLAVAAGGILGRRIGILKFTQVQVQIVTALLVIFVALRIIIKTI